MLEYEGYPVQSAANGKDALEVFENEESPCLILLDLMMPVMDGWEFLRELRQKSGKIPPVVIISAYLDKSKPIEAEGFLRKPFMMGTVIETVRKFCV